MDVAVSEFFFVIFFASITVREPRVTDDWGGSRACCPRNESAIFISPVSF